MKQIILPTTFLEFTWLVLDYFKEENGLALKRKLVPSNRNYQTAVNLIVPKIKNKFPTLRL